MKIGRITLALVFVAAVISIAAPANLPGQPGALASNVAISIQDFRFDPREITITAGDTVVWSNSGFAPHTTTSDSDIWTSGTLTQGGQPFTRTFNTPGTFPYHCSFHDSMTGVITVLPSLTVQAYLPFLARNAIGW